MAEAVYRDMLREANVPVVLEERLDLDRGVRKDGQRITAIVMLSGRVFAGRMFIDATYEGDLMAKAGVSYAVGREPSDQYDEQYNGVAKRWDKHHQFVKPVDPYVVPGDPASGLLPGVQAEPPGEDGQGDRRVQAYCFRMCTTDAPENRLPWPKPKDYDPRGTSCSCAISRRATFACRGARRTCPTARRTRTTTSPSRPTTSA